MADQYDALVSGTPTDPAQQRALAAALRKQAAVAEAYQATGDRVISPLGQTMGKNIEGQLGDISTDREKQTGLAQALKFHQDQQAAEQASLAERTREANMTDARTREQNALMNKFRNDQLDQQKQLKEEGLAQQKALADEKAKQGKPLPAGTFKEISGLKDSLDAIDDSIQTYKPEYSGADHISRNATNFLAANAPTVAGAVGAVNQTDKDAANWYQNYGRNFTIDEMHRLFGARISPTEMATFEKFHINPNQDAATQMLNMQQIRKRIATKINQRLDELKAGGFSPDEVESIRPSDTAGGAGQEVAAPANQVSAKASPYVQAARQQRMAPAPSAPLPSWQMFPQTGLQQQQSSQLPPIPGMSSLFQGMPQGSQ